MGVRSWNNIDKMIDIITLLKKLKINHLAYRDFLEELCPIQVAGYCLLLKVNILS